METTAPLPEPKRDTRFTARAVSVNCRKTRYMKRSVEGLAALHGRKITAAERGALHYFGVESRKN